MNYRLSEEPEAFQTTWNTTWEAILQSSGGLFAGWLEWEQLSNALLCRWQHSKGRGGYSFLWGETEVATAHLVGQIFIQISGWNHNFFFWDIQTCWSQISHYSSSSTLFSLWVLLTLWNLFSPQFFPLSIFCASSGDWSGRPGNLQTIILLVLTAKCMIACIEVRVKTEQLTQNV